MKSRLMALFLVAAGCTHSAAQEPKGPAWTKVGGAEISMSGCALERRESGRADFLVIHDNKKPGEARIGRVTVTSGGTTYKQLAWPSAEPPKDLEAICEFPGHAGRFVTLASAGLLYVIDVAGDTVTLAGPPIGLPKPPAPAEPNYEAFCLQTLDGRLVAIWADRGGLESAARLFWGPFDAAKGPSIAGSAEVRAPWPDRDFTRDIADLRLDGAGVVWSAAAWDNDDDDAVYRSAVYVIGVLRDAASPSGFVAETIPIPVRTFADRKVEGIELLPGAGGGLALCTDDENHGGWFIVE